MQKLFYSLVGASLNHQHTWCLRRCQEKENDNTWDTLNTKGFAVVDSSWIQEARMWPTWLWSSHSPPPWMIHLKLHHCSKHQVSSQKPWVTTESHKRPVSHCSRTTVLPSCLTTLPYKLELREFPLLVLLKELFLGCPHFPLPGLAAVDDDSAVLTCNCLAFFFFSLRKEISSSFSCIISFMRSYKIILQISPVPLILWISPRVQMRILQRISTTAYGSLSPAKRLLQSSSDSSWLGISNLVPLHTTCSRGYARSFESFRIRHLIHHAQTEFRWRSLQADFYQQTNLQYAPKV